MTPSTPPPLQPIPSSPGGRPLIPRNSPRKLIFGIILAGSIVFFVLILLAATVAILHEAAPASHSGVTSLLIAVKRAVAHHIAHMPRHK